MLINRVILVVVLIVAACAQNAPQTRDRRTIQSFLTSVGDLFGYDVFKRPRIVISINGPAAPAPAPAAPAPAPAAPAPAPAAPAPAPAAPAPAPAPAPPARPPAPAPPAPAPPAPPAPAPPQQAPSLLTDSVRRQFSINLNWDRNRSPPSSDPVISAVVVSPPGLAPVPAPFVSVTATAAAVAPAPAAAPAPVPAPAPAAPPLPVAAQAPPSAPSQSNGVNDYEDQSERSSDDYEDRPKRFQIDFPDYSNLEELTENKREVSNEQQESKVKFKKEFDNFWEKAPWTIEHGYKFIVPQESSTLLRTNKPNIVHEEISKHQEINIPKDHKVRSLNLIHNIRFFKKPYEDNLSASSTAVTYYQKAPIGQKVDYVVRHKAEPSYLTSKYVNAELLNFYDQKFKADARNKNKEANDGQQIAPIAPDVSYIEDYNNKDSPLNLYASPHAFFYQQHPSNLPVIQRYVKQDPPLELYANPEIHTGDVKDQTEQEVDDENESIGDEHENIKNANEAVSDEEEKDDKENFESEQSKQAQDEQNDEYKEDAPAEQQEEEQEVENEAEVENETEEDTEDGKSPKIVENNDIENLQVEHLEGERENEEDESLAEQQNEDSNEEDDRGASDNYENEKYDSIDIDSFIKANFGEYKDPDFDRIRQEILEEGEQRAKESLEEAEDEETNEESEAKEEDKEKAKIEELKERHEKEFQNVFPKLGQGTEYENFYDTFNENSKSEASMQNTENPSVPEKVHKKEDEEIGEAAEESSTKNKKSKGSPKKLNKDYTKHRDSSKEIKGLKQDPKSANKDKNQYVNNFDIHNGYKNVKESFAENLGVTPKGNLHQKNPPKYFHPKNTFRDKDNHESTEKTVVQPLYSGVWHAGALQELYHSDKPVKIPFDHEYSASEKQKQVKERSRRAIYEYLQQSPSEMRATNQYIPEKYNEEFFYEVPEPKTLDYVKLEAKNYKDDEKFSPNVRIVSKELGTKRTYVKINEPTTIITN